MTPMLDDDDEVSGREGEGGDECDRSKDNKPACEADRAMLYIANFGGDKPRKMC